MRRTLPRSGAGGPLRSVVWSVALHASVCAGLLLLADTEPASVPVRTSFEVARSADLEPPDPPPPADDTPPERPEIEALPEETPEPPDDLLAEEWEEAREADLRARVRSTVFCPDPLARSERFAPRRPRAPSAAAPPAVPVFPVPPVAEPAPPPPPPPTPAGIEALVKPLYPRTARERGLEGAVRLRVVIEADGTIVDVQVVESSGYAVLDRAAVAAVEDWTFRPATALGRAVRSTLELPPIQFRLTD